MHTLEFVCISCLKLKNLRIDNLSMVQDKVYLLCGKLEISCPKLVFLALTGAIAHNFFFGSLDSLKKAVIHREMLDFEESERMDDTLCKLFSRISHVESLSIRLSFVVKRIDLSLPNLKTLELTIDCGSVMCVLQFLKNFPDLESLHFNFTWAHYLQLDVACFF